jgi:hypothetical protein
MKHLVITLLAATALAGCASPSPYRPVPFDRATSGVNQIQIVDDALAEKQQIRKLATNGQNIAASTSGLGLAGLVVGMVAAGVEAGIASDQTNKINSALASQNFDGEAVFDKALEAALTSQDYQISSIKIDRDTGRSFVVVTPQADAKSEQLF